nr:hypothetical protein [uncultured Prevotella sp.]
MEKTGDLKEAIYRLKGLKALRKHDTIVSMAKEFSDIIKLLEGVYDENIKHEVTFLDLANFLEKKAKEFVRLFPNAKVELEENYLLGCWHFNISPIAVFKSKKCIDWMRAMASEYMRTFNAINIICWCESFVGAGINAFYKAEGEEYKEQISKE